MAQSVRGNVRKAKAPAQKRPVPVIEEETLSDEQVLLNELLDKARASAKKAVRSDVSADTAKRDLCRYVFDIVATGCPDMLQRDSQMRSHNHGVISPVFLKWLRANNLPAPSMKTDNIILPMFKSLWLSAQRDDREYTDPFVGATIPEKPTPEAYEQDIPTFERPMAALDIQTEATATSAQKMMLGRYARLAMAAVDMGERAVIDYSFRWLSTVYKDWVANPQNRSLIRPMSSPSDARGDSSGDTSTKDEEIETEEEIDADVEAAADDAADPETQNEMEEESPELVAVNPNPESTEIALDEKAVQPTFYKALPRFKGVATFRARWDNNGVLHLKWV